MTVNEFITMLLDFPIEPDASTMEIISDSVYANSSVLDGRRFATEFVSRRKADIARTRSNGNPNGVGASGGASGAGVGASGSKIVSIADGGCCSSSHPQVFDFWFGAVFDNMRIVVKAQPKTVEKDWGYKVVKKKGKKT